MRSCRHEGSVAKSHDGHETAGDKLRLGGRPEEGSREFTLSLHVIGWDARSMALADHRHGQVTRQSPWGCHETLEAQFRTNQPLDPLVILLDAKQR
jgi:hypothetical protein